MIKPIPDLLSDDIFRFWTFVQKTDICWNWTGYYSFGKHSLPRLRINGKYYRASRIVWKIITGNDPGEMFVLHTCCNEKCVNPDHLYLGSHTDNMNDRTADHPNMFDGLFIGSGNNHSKLVEDDIKIIRSSYKTQKQLAAEFGVSQPTISGIINRKTWVHI